MLFLSVHDPSVLTRSSRGLKLGWLAEELRELRLDGHRWDGVTIQITSIFFQRDILLLIMK